MAFLLNNQPIFPGTSFADADGNQYPKNWAQVLSQEVKDQLGIVWVADPAPVDTRFYWDHEVPKQLEDEPAVDDEGAPVLDGEGVQVINRGIKGIWIAKQKEIAGTLLAPSDWYIIRKADTGIDMPADVKQYRDNVRLTCGLREDQIAQCTTTEQLAALLTNPAVLYDRETGSTTPNTEPFITPWPEQDR